MFALPLIINGKSRLLCMLLSGSNRENHPSVCNSLIRKAKSTDGIPGRPSHPHIRENEQRYSTSMLRTFFLVNELSQRETSSNLSMTLPVMAQRSWRWYVLPLN